jgi:hypothetical protein
MTALACGCAGSGPKHHLALFGKRKQQPTRMVLLISPSRAEDAVTPAQQGMMCRAYFFAGENPHPVEVDGDVAFTAYDRANPDINRKPDGVFQIPADRLPSHLRRDIVGNSYLFWLPYEPADSTQMLVQGKLQLSKRDALTSSVVSVDLSPAVSAKEIGTMYQYSFSPAARARSAAAQKSHIQPIRPQSSARRPSYRRDQPASTVSLMKPTPVEVELPSNPAPAMAN